MNEINPNEPVGQPSYRDAKAQAKAAKAYANAQRPWFKKKRFVIPGAVVALMVVIQMGGGGSEDPAVAASGDTNSAAVVDAESVEGSDDTGKKTKASPEKQAEPASEPVEEEPKPQPVVKAVAVDAADILKEFEGNEAAADLKYEGKTLKVTGNVYKVDTEVWDEEQYVVQLDTGSDWDFLTVNCNDMAADEVATLTPNSTATVVGQFDDGGDLGVELKDCTLAK